MIRPLLALALLGLPGIAHAADKAFLVGSFTRVRVNGPFRVTIATGKSPGAHASGSLDALHALTLQTDGDTLVVSMGAGNWTTDAGETVTPPTITLTTPTLQSAMINAGATLTVDAMKGQKVSLALNGSGELDVGAITADQLEARIVGTGRMALAGTAQRAQVIVNGPGSVAASDLVAGDLVARSDGPGTLDLAARYTATVTTTGLGAVTVAGSPSCTVHAYAGGPVRCGKQQD
jgi:hypothetical protein